MIIHEKTSFIRANKSLCFIRNSTFKVDKIKWKHPKITHAHLTLANSHPGAVTGNWLQKNSHQSRIFNKGKSNLMKRWSRIKTLALWGVEQLSLGLLSSPLRPLAPPPGSLLSTSSEESIPLPSNQRCVCMIMWVVSYFPACLVACVCKNTLPPHPRPGEVLTLPRGRDPGPAFAVRYLPPLETATGPRIGQTDQRVLLTGRIRSSPRWSGGSPSVCDINTKVALHRYRVPVLL